MEFEAFCNFNLLSAWYRKREKKYLNIPQRDSHKNWYHRNCESQLFIFHNVINLKTAIMQHCFSCKNKQWILLRGVSWSFQIFLMKRFCINIVGIFFCFLQLEYLVTKSILICIKKGYIKMTLSQFLVKVYDCNTIILL